MSSSELLTSSSEVLCESSPDVKICAFDGNLISTCIKWTVDDVVKWVETELQFPQYKECFSKNFVSGRKLILMDASNLPRIGITDFEHIKFITSKIRELLNIPYPDWNRSITLPPRETNEHFYERKSVRGSNSEKLTYEAHVRYLEEFRKHGVEEK